jgi:hypothetical protein
MICELGQLGQSSSSPMQALITAANSALDVAKASNGNQFM